MSGSGPTSTDIETDAGPEGAAEDHRSRTAKLRREQMRRRLIESAILVFAEQGVNAAVIGQVIEAAGVSRGSFYNHFRTNDELCDAICEDLADELVAYTENVIAGSESADGAVALGATTVLSAALHYPVLGLFMGARSLNAEALMREISDGLNQQLHFGMASGTFVKGDIGLAADMVLGMLRAGMLRLAMRQTAPLEPKDYIRGTVAAILRALGLGPERAETIAAIDLTIPAFAEDSLIARAQARHDAYRKKEA